MGLGNFFFHWNYSNKNLLQTLLGWVLRMSKIFFVKNNNFFFHSEKVWKNETLLKFRRKQKKDNFFYANVLLFLRDVCTFFPLQFFSVLLKFFCIKRNIESSTTYLYLFFTTFRFLVSKATFQDICHLSLSFGLFNDQFLFYVQIVANLVAISDTHWHLHTYHMNATTTAAAVVVVAAIAAATSDRKLSKTEFLKKCSKLKFGRSGE